MKRPYMNRFPVHEWDYEEKDISAVIYSYYEKTPRDDEFEYEDEDEELDENDEEDTWIHNKDTEEKNSIRKLKLEDINLQMLIDNLPEGVQPSDVKISMYIDCSDMAVEGTKLSFHYHKHLPARPELYKRDKEAFDKEYAEFQEKLAAYEKWEKEQQIKELEDKLSNLKK
jgi:hypothetical protein